MITMYNNWENITRDELLKIYVENDVCDSMVADGYVLSEPDKYEIAFQDKTAPEQFGIAMSKDNTQLQKAIDDAITEMKEDGTLDDIYQKWFAVPGEE